MRQITIVHDFPGKARNDHEYVYGDTDSTTLQDCVTITLRMRRAHFKP